LIVEKNISKVCFENISNVVVGYIILSRILIIGAQQRTESTPQRRCNNRCKFYPVPPKLNNAKDFALVLKEAGLIFLISRCPSSFYQKFKLKLG
jgi:hypothetical protein